MSSQLLFQAAPGESFLYLAPTSEWGADLLEQVREAGYNAKSTTAAADALRMLGSEAIDLLVVDLAALAEAATQFFERVRELQIRTVIIALCEPPLLEAAMQTMRFGVADVLVSPVEPENILLAAKKVEERERLRSENELLKSQVAKRYSFSNIIAKSPRMLEIFETVRKVADYKTTVMIYGESGTGKELIARALHHNSLRRNKRFVAINCGAIPENLLESELFGHKRGAFTDATRDKKGLFEEAEGGTILLDEIGELPLHLQVKLLRVLQEGEIKPVGDSRSIPINVRIVAATLRDLENDVLEGRFRDDLFYRLNVVTVKLPPLRERKEDIPVLVQYLLKKNQERLGLGVYGVTKEAMTMLLEHEWPGNIRELENCIERAMILTEGEEISAQSLPRSLTLQSKPAPQMQVLGEDLSIKNHSRVLEETLIRKALEQTNGNRTHAARLLEISHRTLLYKLKEYHLVDTEETGELES